MESRQRPLISIASGISKGAIVIQGRKYLISRVIGAYERLVDALTQEYGGESQFLTNGMSDHDWRTRKPEVYRKVWDGLTANFDCNTRFNVHRFQGFRARAYLGGNDYCVFNRDRGRYSTARGRPLEELDAEPKVLFFGDGRPRRGHGADFAEEPTLPLEITGAIQRLVESDEFRSDGLRFECGDLAPGPDGKLRQDCRVAFPYQVYGGGEAEYIRVSCRTPDGRPFDPEDGGTN